MLTQICIFSPLGWSAFCSYALLWKSKFHIGVDCFEKVLYIPRKKFQRIFKKISKIYRKSENTKISAKILRKISKSNERDSQDFVHFFEVMRPYISWIHFNLF